MIMTFLVFNLTLWNTCTAAR